MKSLTPRAVVQSLLNHQLSYVLGSTPAAESEIKQAMGDTMDHIIQLEDFATMFKFTSRNRQILVAVFIAGVIYGRRRFNLRY
jgi:hypothetical protein